MAVTMTFLTDEDKSELQDEIRAVADVIGGGGSVEVDLLTPENLVGNFYMWKTGALTSSGSWETYAVKPQYVKLVFSFLTNDFANIPGVGFYSSATPSEATFISGIHATAQSDIKEITVTEDDIPAGTELIAFSSRVATGAGTALVGTIVPKTELDDLWDAVDELREDVGKFAESEPVEVDLLTLDNLVDNNGGQCYMSRTGALASTASWITYAVKPEYDKIVFNGYCPTWDATPLVGFYSSENPSENTFIRGIVLPNTTDFHEVTVTKDDIPEGTKLILFSSRTASGNNTALVGTYTPPNELDALKEIVNELESESRGKGNVKAIFANIPNSNDFTVIKDEIWFAQNIYENGVATEYTTIHRYRIEDGKLVHLSDIDSDFGHWNTVDYCEENDCLIFTNAANLETTEGNYFTVVKNPLALGTVARIADCGIKYNTNYGFKIQAVWGDDNFGKHNVVYLTSNYTANIYKLMLMRDANGEFTKDSNGYGSFVELETATNPTGIGTGGGDFWGDTLYIGNGGGYGYFEMSMSDYSSKKITKRFYYDDGTAYSGSTQGIHVDSRYIWVFYNIAGLTDDFLVQYYR